MIKKHISAAEISIICLVLVLMSIGVVLLYSATQSMPTHSRLMTVQIVAGIVGIICAFIATIPDYEQIGMWAWFIFGFCILLLIAVLLFSTSGDETGTQRWFNIGGLFSIQPSEFVKVGYIITISWHVSRIKADLNNLKNVFFLICHVGIYFALVMLQPDLGTALVFLTIFLGIVFVAGISIKYIITVGVAVGAFAPIAWLFLLQDYQKKRVFAFLDPEGDPSGDGYQVLQSKIAIGSGRLVGNGLLSGTQNQMGYLPGKQTDFIFAVAGEAWGLIGSIAILVIFVGLIISILVVAGRAKDSFGESLAVGVAFMLMFHVFENICMCIGLMPVTGIPLPFLSYGGSSLLSVLISIGIVLNVGVRKKRTVTNEFEIK